MLREANSCRLNVLQANFQLGMASIGVRQPKTVGFKVRPSSCQQVTGQFGLEEVSQWRHGGNTAAQHLKPVPLGKRTKHPG